MLIRMDEHLDRLARDLASGQLSRRSALKRLAGAATAAALGGPVGALASITGDAKRCPESRRCKGKCCPANSHCRRGKCRCLAGYTKCNGKCFDLETNPSHCGNCETVCDSDKPCINGTCAQCVDNGDCSESEVCSNHVCIPA
ncbi:MAG: hypothetical protein QOI31_1286 [Solirubrobacterales bacterium]|jgi:hypothetical protein|nr:hypothetical protein [Solirubrobacterales bacterium]MEA2523226.1 hypothetical protein [Thermomicrobiales bacterium]